MHIAHLQVQMTIKIAFLRRKRWLVLGLPGVLTTNQVSWASSSSSAAQIWKFFFSHRSLFLCVYPAIHMQEIYYRSNQRWNSGEHEQQFIHNLRPAVLRVNSLQLNSAHITAGACSTFGILHATKLLPLVGRGLWSPPCTCRISVWTVEQAVQLRGSP